MGVQPGSTLKVLRRAVPTATVAVQLSSTNLAASYITIQAAATNTGYIYVGDSTVAPTLCAAVLDSGQTYSLNMPREWAPGVKFNLADIWIESSVNGEEVNVGYLD